MILVHPCPYLKAKRAFRKFFWIREEKRPGPVEPFSSAKVVLNGWLIFTHPKASLRVKNLIVSCLLTEGYGKIVAHDPGMRHFRPTGTVLSCFTDQVVQTCNSAAGNLLQNARM